VKRADRHFFRLAYAAWLLGIAAFFIPAATWNPVSRFDLTRAIVDRHQLSIDADASSTGDRALVRGEWFTDKAPMPSLLALPTYALTRGVQALRGARPAYRAYGTATTPAIRFYPNAPFQQALYLCSLMTAGLGGMAIGLLMFELLRRRTSSRNALFASTVAVIGTPILPYATSFYGHVPAGAALLGALVALDTRGQRNPAGTPTRARVRLAGLCLALAPGCEYITAGPAALIGLAFLLQVPRGARLQAVLDLALGALAPVLAVSAYHTVVFGAPWRTGYSFIARPEFAAGHAHGLLGINLPRWQGLVGLTVGTRRGLFFLSPVLLAGLVLGAARAWRTRDRTLLVGLLASLLLLLMNAGYYMWWGGAAAGPRHLVPTIALLAAGLALFHGKHRRWAAPVLTALALISIVNCVALTVVGIEAPENGNILTTFVWPALREGRVSSNAGAANIGLKLGLAPAISTLPLIGWLTLGYWYLAGLVASRRARPEPAGATLPRHEPR
jgi:hypothetical protein